MAVCLNLSNIYDWGNVVSCSLLVPLSGSFCESINKRIQVTFNLWHQPPMGYELFDKVSQATFIGHNLCKRVGCGRRLVTTTVLADLLE